MVKTLYHGSKDIIEHPRYGAGKPYNDYGRGFYCTESLDLAKEWAVAVISGVPVRSIQQYEQRRKDLNKAAAETVAALARALFCSVEDLLE